ncbi:MAG: ABC transporter ATP-binding protein [Gemmatimonadaceae bacterium]
MTAVTFTPPTVAPPAGTSSPGAAAAPRTPADAGGAPMVSLREVTKSFPVRRDWRQAIRHPTARDGFPVLRDVSLTIQPGEFFGLLGPNGAGKSTLFKTLATLILPDGGTVVIDGHDVVREAGRVRRLVALVGTDERSLFWRATASDNLALYATLHGLRGAEARRRVAESLETVELADTGRRMVGQFSSGMKQRLLIARALLPRPRVLLLDEPTRSLDPISARRFRAFLRTELAGRQRCTLLLATHNPEEALDLCDRVAVLHHGRLLAVGPADALVARYGEDRYSVAVPAAQSPRLLGLLAAHAIAPVTVTPLPPDERARGDDRDRVEVVIPAAGPTSTATIRMLLDGGVDVLWFERVGLTLADLLERVVRGGGPPADA